MQNLEPHHLLRLQRFAYAAQRGEDVSALGEEMQQTLGPLLTEKRLDEAMQEARDGKYDAIDGVTTIRREFNR